MARGSLKPRELNYSQVGTAGRRTGITLNQGQLDEHGMEEIDGMFSSPEKSPAKLNGFDDNDSTGSEGMSMDEGNAPGPMDFLNGANHRSSVLPPSTRSPAKRVNGSVRRSPVLRSSPEQDDLMSPSPSEGKSLVAPGDSRQDPSPLTVRSVNAGTTSQSNARRNTKAQLAASEPSVVHDFSDGEGDENADFAQGQTDFHDSPGAGDETVFPDEEAPEASEAGSNDADAAGETSQEPKGSRPAGKTTASKSTKKGPAAKTTKATNGKSKSAQRGRAAKSQRPAEDDGETAESRPAKKRKTTDSQGPRPPAENLDPELDKVVENYAQRSGPLKGRSLYILKKEDPTDTSSTHTRSGRVSIRPLAYWRNERCVYGDGEAAEGQRYPLSTIKEVVRTEELEPEKGKKGKRSRKTKSKKRQDESSDEDEDVDQWEKEGGILHGYVPKWDPKTQNTAEEEILDIAYAPSGIETREVKDSTFRFAKLLSSSFIGSGVVELPPEGVKKPKNSKKMHMVFYVCHGRVQVSISDVQFSAGKGSVFQVPRGNYYSFANPFGKEARLFFTQGCVPSEGDESPPSGAKNAGPESEAETESGPSAPKTKKDTAKAKDTAKGKETAKAKDTSKARGRPKGKQKTAK